MTPQQQIKGRWPLPPGWSWVALGTVADVKGGSAKATRAQADPEGTIPLIHSGDLHNRKAITITGYITEQKYAAIVGSHMGHDLEDHQLARKLLVAAARETTGRIGILDAERAVFNNAVFAFTPKAHIRLDYLFYYFLMESTRRYITEEVAPGPRAFTGSKLLSQKMPVPQPPLNQGDPLVLQDRIIERIETLTRDAQQAQERLATMRTDLFDAFNSLLGQLFTARMAAWPRVPLRELVTVQEGRSYRGQAEYQQAPYIAPDSIISSIGVHLLYPPFAEARIQGAEQNERYVLRNDGATVLYVSELPEARRAVLLDQEQAVCSRTLIALSIKERERLLPSFLLYALLAPHFTRFALMDAADARIARISSDTLLSYPLPLPEREEQESIINYLNNNQQLIDNAQALLASGALAIEQAQSAILEQAFRGGL